MQFDKIAGCLERHKKSLAKKLEKSRLFICPESEVKVARARIKEFCEDKKDVDEVALRLRLPFPYTAVEIPEYNYVTVFYEFEPEEKASIARIIKQEWGMEPAVLYGYIYGCFGDKNDWIVCEGTIMIEKHAPGEYDGSARSYILKAVGHDPLSGYRDINMGENPELARLHNEEFSPLAIQAMTGLFHLNASGDFVVEKTPRRDNKKKRKKHKRSIVKRTEERPHYIFVKPNKALEFFNPGGWGNKRTPHARRGHLRRYQDGKITWVRATWVGLQQRTDKKARYKIMLDV